MMVGMEVGAFPTAAAVAGLSGAELDRALVEVERARRQVEAAYLAVLDRADTTGRYAIDGHASIRGWATALANVAPTETHRRLQTMRATRDVPDLLTALADGRIGVDQARDIAKVHANPRARHALTDPADSACLAIAAAGTKPYQDFADMMRRWERFADPTGAARSDADAHARRDASVFERDGVIHLHARCGTAQGAAILEIFAEQCEAEFHADWDQASAIHGRDTNLGLLARTDPQRRMDALAALVLAAASTPPGATPPEPVVNIVMTIDEYETRLAALLHGDEPTPVPPDRLDAARCETTTGIPIDPTDAIIASLTGWVRRTVIDSAGVVTDLGRKRRFTGSARDAVLLSNGRRCLWPGCGRNSRSNHIDHTHEHARGGRTCTDNGGPACSRHNRWKANGYTAHRNPDGTWIIRRPDGIDLTQPASA
jgi:hypothetical protein